MTGITANFARSITWASSQQTYWTIRLMVDKELASDCYRAYAYFRWADDVIDVAAQSGSERIGFITRQRELIDCLYRNERPEDLVPEEELVADLISHDTTPNSGLQSFVRGFVAILEFDACRMGRLISEEELTWYTECLGKSVTDGIQYFVGNGHPYPSAGGRYLAATAAHIAHLLRDMVLDTADGFNNISREYREAHGIGPDDVDGPACRDWVRDRVQQARRYFHEGKHYLDSLDVLRCKIVGYWYCARFEGVLDTIERDGYILRATYDERRHISTWFKIAWLGVSLTLHHIARKGLHRT